MAITAFPRPIIHEARAMAGQHKAMQNRRALKLALVFGPSWVAALVVAGFILTLG